MIEQLQALMASEYGSLILLALLVVALIVAFKIMEMVFEVLTVSVLSGVFYLALVYLFNYPLTFQRLLLFAFLGATLYMAYSFLTSAYSIASKLIEIPYRLAKFMVIAPVKHLRNASGTMTDLRRKYRRMKVERQKKQDGKEEGGERNVKEVVLDKVKEDD